MNRERTARFHMENILYEADKLFSSYGFEKTTIEMIAKESQYSKPTIYAYFDSKEEIYACNLYKNMLDLKEEFEEVLSLDLSAKEIYLKCCHTVLNFKINHRVYFLGVIGDVDYKNNLHGTNNYAIGELGDSINKKVCKVFDKAISEGLIDKDINVDFCYSYIWSCVIGIIISYKFDPANFDTAEEFYCAIDKCFMTVVEGVLNANK